MLSAADDSPHMSCCLTTSMKRHMKHMLKYKLLLQLMVKVVLSQKTHCFLSFTSQTLDFTSQPFL